MILVLCAAVGAIWLAAVYGTYKESQYPKYDVRVSPGAVSYGTRSSATMPTVSAPLHRSAVPMISGGDVRSYAYNGHASYLLHHSPYTIHTTSSATVHTIGSGGGGVSSPLGDRGASSSGDRGASSRGITYGGASVSVPSLALVTTSFASSSAATAAETARYRMGPRRTPGSAGSEYGEIIQDEDGIWYWDEEVWQKVADGDIKIEDGKTYVYVNGAWVEVSNQTDPTNPTPLGDMPWIGMLLLVLGYGAFKAKKRSCL